MSLKVADNVIELIGHTPMLKIPSLSRLTGCNLYVKCESQNPGGSVKDRAARQMIQDAIASGRLKPGMTIVEGTAGNTGIGLALVARALGYQIVVCMPKGQTPEKQRMIELNGAKLHLVEPVPFSDNNHFYHTARRIMESDPKKFWWADQFNNLSNYQAHYQGTGPEIYQQLGGNIDWLVSVAGSGGTIAGCGRYLKQMNGNIKVRLVDPQGSGLKNFVQSGKFVAEGSSITEGIGIMRLVDNFKEAKVDDAVTLPDQDFVTLSRFVRDQDGIVLGSSSALNVAGALYTAVQEGPGKTIVTFLCDQGERSYSKLYNPDFLREKSLDPESDKIEQLMRKYQTPGS